MNYSMQKLYDDFMKKIGDSDLRTLDTMPTDVAVNYVFFLYNKFYEAYPTGEMFEVLSDRFGCRMAA